MSFNDLATQIVKKSIRSAICIDDEFAEPYESATGKIKTEIPSKLYKSFRDDGNCSLDFYRFKPEDNWEEKSQIVLSNKDLIILDWELNVSATKYSETLPILESIIKHGSNQFVIIYTHSPDLKDIVTNIQAFYSNTNIVTKDKKIDHLREAFEETGETYDEFGEHLKGLISKDKIFNHNANFKVILDDFGINGEDYGKFIVAAKKILNIKDTHEILEFILLDIYYLRSISNTSERKIINVNSDRIILNVDNTIILISKKSEDGQEDGKILPENLFNSFTEAIINKPSNALALMACELKDIFRSNVSLIGNNIPQIDEKAFYNHWKNLRKEDEPESQTADEQFKYFLLQTWLNEISQFTMKTSANISFFEALIKYGTEQNLFETDFEDPIDELIKLGAHYSTLNIDISQRADKKIQFGDIFWKQNNKSRSINEVLLSITPHCDSVRPDKINNLLHFVHGYVVTETEEKKEALKNSESDHYSFLMINGDPVCIKWNTKPFSIFIEKGKNDVTNSIEINYKDKKAKLKILTVLKENYTQRIANESFSYAMRVGITLPSLKK